MDNERYLWLVMRNLTGEITGEEKQELDQLLKQFPFEEEKYNLVKKFWTQEVFYNHSADTNEALNKVLEKINSSDIEQVKASKTYSFPLFKRIAVAAMISLGLVLGFFVYKNLNGQKKQVALIEKYNMNGTRSMITLSDGTRVWLNSDSKINYPEVFDDKSREVYLTGEAFFNVAHNSKKPFLIYLNNAKIKVIGTSFNVKAYTNEEDIETSVVTGKVAFIPDLNSNADTVFLTKNKKVTFSIHSGEIVTETANTNEDKEWINGKLIFKSETLGEISRQLERSFGKKIHFRNEKLRDNKYTGSFDDSSLEEILYYLSLSKAFKYTTTDSTLTIY